MPLRLLYLIPSRTVPVWASVAEGGVKQSDNSSQGSGLWHLDRGDRETRKGSRSERLRIVAHRCHSAKDIQRLEQIMGKFYCLSSLLLCPDLRETLFPRDTKTPKGSAGCVFCRAPAEAHRKSHRPASLVPDGARRPWDALFHL